MILIGWSSQLEETGEQFMVRIEIEGRGVLIAGPLEDIARRFEDEFVRRGFTRKSLMNQLRLLAHLSRWLQARASRWAS